MLDKPARDEALGAAGRIHTVKAHDPAIYRSVNTPRIDVEKNALDTNRLVRLSCDGSAMEKHHVQHDYRQRQQANCVDFPHGYRPFLKVSFPGEKKWQGFTLALHTPDPAQAGKLFNALAERGNITLPLKETFWAIAFGAVTDEFGISWMVNCEKRM